MAPMCLVPLQSCCYCADRDCSSSPEADRLDREVFYESHASVLCGDWLCGGTLDFPATASGRSSNPVPVSGPFVEICTRAWARAPVAHPFRQTRAHCFPPASNSQPFPFRPFFLVPSLSFRAKRGISVFAATSKNLDPSLRSGRQTFTAAWVVPEICRTFQAAPLPEHRLGASPPVLD